MKLKMTINKIKCIDNLAIELPIEKGLYAITGQNGSGKSTIVTCASSVFFNIPLNDYFGKTDDDSYILFELGESKRIIKKENRKWKSIAEGDKMNIRGFYEGSLIFGNRFKDASYDKLKAVEAINTNKLIPANDFIRKNLGEILHGDADYYEKLWLVSSKYERFDGKVFFYEKLGRRISQFHMSTGENLLVSVLNSLYLRNQDRQNTNKPCVIFLDEIELALHPASLKRLILFLEKMSMNYNYAIYFSTHSIELISAISPENIFFVERHQDNTIEILNPCYPAYATRILYDHSGYDNVILVEDDLSKEIIRRVLKKERLLNSRLVHVMPCGGYINVLNLANDVVRNNLLGKKASVCVVLDLDVKDKVEEYICEHKIKNNVPVNYLPIESLEKYLRTKLYKNVNHALFRKLNDYIFLQKSLSDIIKDYSTSKNSGDDHNGKILYRFIDSELKARNKSRKDIIEITVDFLFEENGEEIKKIVSFLRKQFRITN